VELNKENSAVERLRHQIVAIRGLETKILEKRRGRKRELQDNAVWGTRDVRKSNS